MSRIINFPNYDLATNSAYKLLAERDLFSIETNIFSIVEQLENCCIYTYGRASFISQISLDTFIANSEYGFSIKHKNNNHRIIYYNEQMPLSSIRFTLAHEIGHMVLDHQDEDNPAAEKEANCFARNLLCPLPVAIALDMESIDDYTSAFNVSNTMASTTISCRSSDAYYIDTAYSKIVEDKLYAYAVGYESFVEFEKHLLA